MFIPHCHHASFLHNTPCTLLDSMRLAAAFIAERDFQESRREGAERSSDNVPERSRITKLSPFRPAPLRSFIQDVRAPAYPET